MADDTSIDIRANGDLDKFQKSRLILKDGDYRWLSIVLEQMLQEKKFWGHVQSTVAVLAAILILGAGALPRSQQFPPSSPPWALQLKQ